MVITLLKEKETLYNHGDILDFKNYINFFLKFLKLSHHVALPGLELKLIKVFLPLPPEW